MSHYKFKQQKMAIHCEIAMTNSRVRRDLVKYSVIPVCFKFKVQQHFEKDRFTPNFKKKSYITLK